MRVIDCFTFYNELDMLEYRLHTLAPVVDYFVLVEAAHTHAGHPKECIFNTNRSRFAPFLEKIVHVQVTDMPHVQPHVNVAANHVWINENHQRRCIGRGLAQLPGGVLPTDLLIISDLDEIPDPELLTQFKEGRRHLIHGVGHLKQDMYYYNLNSFLQHGWDAAKLVTGQKYLATPDAHAFRFHKGGENIERGGWHLSYFGDVRFIQNKLKEFSHQEFNKQEHTSEQVIAQRMANQTDVVGRNIPIRKIPLAENPYLPPHCRTMLAKYILY